MGDFPLTLKISLSAYGCFCSGITTLPKSVKQSSSLALKRLGFLTFDVSFLTEMVARLTKTSSSDSFNLAALDFDFFFGLVSGFGLSTLASHHPM